MQAIYEGNPSAATCLTLHQYKNLVNLPHYHHEHELIHVDRGSAAVLIRQTCFLLAEGDTAFVHAEEIHSVRAEEDTVITVLKADDDYFAPLFGNERLSCPILNKGLFHAAFFRELRDELARGDRYGRIIAPARLSAALAQMLRREETFNSTAIPPQDNTHRIYDRISELISREYATLTFSEAAAYMHFTEPYFSKLFSKLFGMSFTRYLNTVRIGTAITILREGNSTIAKTARDCGFNTIRSFNRSFKQMTGYSPSELPADYTFLYKVKNGAGLNPTLNCTERIY